MDEKKLVKMMDGLGFKESTSGTADIRRGVQIIAANPDAMLCKDVYPALCGGDRRGAARIERRMRNAIQAAMQNPNWGEAWTGLGGWGKPSNSELMRRLARECRDED